MPRLALSDLRQQLASGRMGPLYVLVGEDEVEKSAIAGEFAEIVEEGLRAFNVERLFGADARPTALIASANTLPMLAPRRLIVVIEAEKLLVPKRESKAIDDELERLEQYIADPAPHATVVFVCGVLDARRRVVKRLLEAAWVVDGGQLGDSPADAQRWVASRAKALGVTIDSAAAKELVARAGVNLPRLRAGLDRVAVYAAGQARIGVEDVQQAVSVAPEAPANFGINDAIRANDVREALRELSRAIDDGAAPYFVLGQLRSAAESLPASRAKQGVEAVFRTDLALKSSNGDPVVLLQRLVVELCGDRGNMNALLGHQRLAGRGSPDERT
jgi:DNA polymerase-3 subunit delta